ncbi:MAG: hybrid sensor histidine kinase/response regulator, partial [Candidatus Omnitrophica bacterium]|nr:hybrid sensor histidine kinase/response regulator [Candidatus Omnitrophota bacterium]
MPEPARREAPRPINVLLIEDTAEDARLMQEALTRQPGAPCELLHAEQLSAGLARLSDGGVDVVLLDLVLPDSEGLDTLLAVRRHAPRVPVVVLTASDDGALALQALQQGAQDYLVKASVQVSPTLLGRSIRYAIERQRVERLKDEFVNTVSHELRTPLSTIQEFTGILFDQIPGPLTAEQREYLTIIRSNIERLTRMIDNLLDMAKIDAGHAVLRKSVTEVAPLIQQTVQSLGPIAKHKGIELEVRVPDELPSLYADADKVTQVLVNLLSNAIKFTPGPGRVTVSVSEGESDLAFSVADTGVGIAEGDVPKLFEKFSRVHQASGDEATRGTGLGLAISKRLVELHGGTIGVTSRPGQGSAFTFMLPKYHEAELFHELFQAGI